MFFIISLPSIIIDINSSAILNVFDQQIQKKNFVILWFYLLSMILTNLLSFSKEYNMISLKVISQADYEVSKINRNRHQKITTQLAPPEFDQLSQTYNEQLNARTELLKTAQTNPQTQDDEKSKPTLKLPLISKKPSENPSESNDTIDRKEQQNQLQDLKCLQGHPYLRKIIERKSSDKLKSQGSCNFLSIVGMKPGIRSTSRMSSKDASNSLVPERLQRPDKLLPLKDSDNNRLFGENDNEVREVKTKERRTSSKYKNATISRGQSLSKQKQKIPPSQKKRSTLKLEKPKQSPSYFQWCQFISLLDGVISQKENSATYKAFVGKGNNSIMVKSIIKSRPWWSLCQQESEGNLSWTQSRNPKFLSSLKQGPAKLNLEWNKVVKAKMELFGTLEWGLSDKTKDCIDIGFYKLLSQSQRQILAKSPANVDLVYPTEVKLLQSLKSKAHNHLQYNWNLSNKKALYYNMKAYYIATGKDPFENIPETYHVQKEGDDEWNNFLKGYEKKGLWIIKPGENSNRGCGINVVETIDQVREIVRNKSVRANGKPRSHIVQRYLMPFLYNRRKFDIRAYMLVTSMNGNMRCYWYEQGYVRTASKEFTTKNLKNRMIHLTNDAVQKHSQSYGKHESGNKLSFADFHKYVKNTETEYDFFLHCYPRMVKLAADSIRSTYQVIDAKHRQFSFQIFGLDFMIDQNFKTWLIEVNTNPCLELSCPLLARIIPSMLQNAFRVVIDPLFPPPKDFPKHKGLPEELFEGNKFSLVFNSRQEQELGGVLQQANRLHDIVESDEQSGCEDQE